MLNVVNICLIAILCEGTHIHIEVEQATIDVITGTQVPGICWVLLLELLLSYPRLAYPKNSNSAQFSVMDVVRIWVNIAISIPFSRVSAPHLYLKPC